MQRNGRETGARSSERRRGVPVVALTLALVVGVGAATALTIWRDREPIPSFRAQACGIPRGWLELVQRGYYAPRSGQISLLPKLPAYMASGAGGWSHSGPWPYLVDVPIVFYGPEVVPEVGDVDTPATLADVAPTIAALLHGTFRTDAGRPLEDVAGLDAKSLERPIPKLVLTIVWDGGGWNTLERWPDSWPTLARWMDEGVTYTEATVGSSPSVTPATHTNLGTGVLPDEHGITGINVLDDTGAMIDAFQKGDSSEFLRVPALGELWDEQNGNEALIGMVGYEPWHLGMIGKGAERPGGDRDDAVWLNIETNDWESNPAHYRLPPALVETPGLEQDLATLDAADGEVDGAWLDHEILDQPDRIEETPAFIVYHTRAMLNMIERDGYGGDKIADLLYTNYKQIDRVGHYFNMASPEVRDSIAGSDRQLGVIEDALNRLVGRGNWVVVVTADHGQQPDAPAIDGYGINPKEVEADIEARFGEVVQGVRPTEVFLDADAMEREDVAVEDIARFIADYRLRDNTLRPDILSEGSGEFSPSDRIFDMAIPADMLPGLDCDVRGGTPAPG